MKMLLPMDFMAFQVRRQRVATRSLFTGTGRMGAAVFWSLLIDFRVVTSYLVTSTSRSVISYISENSFGLVLLLAVISASSPSQAEV